MILIQRNSQTGAVRHLCTTGIEGQRLAQQVGLVVMRAEDVGGVGLAIDIQNCTREMKHRRRTDSQLEVAADVAGYTGGLGDVRDLDRRGDAAFCRDKY